MKRRGDIHLATLILLFLAALGAYQLYTWYRQGVLEEKWLELKYKIQAHRMEIERHKREMLKELEEALEKKKAMEIVRQNRR